jgi:hypothetical protein
MRREEVRELKASLTRGVGLQAYDPSGGGTTPTSVFFGIVPDIGITGDRYRLAVRTTVDDDETRAFVAALTEQYGDDVEVRHVGQVRALTQPGDPTDPGDPDEPAVTPEQLQQRLRPLVRGASVAHYRVTAGTIGAFAMTADADGDIEGEPGEAVDPPASPATHVLSNNHVLGDSGRGEVGDDVMQPGPYDGGGADDVIGTLAVTAPLSTDRHNVVDGALAVLAAGVEVDLEGFDGALTGVADAPDPREQVRKIGRTTGITDGQVTAVEVDSVPIGYDIGTLIFDDQIEIEGITGAFSAGGDSGSLIYDGRHQGVGLLFAGSDTGGSTGHGLTYANPLPAVLEALGATLIVPVAQGPSEPTDPGDEPTDPGAPTDPGNDPTDPAQPPWPDDATGPFGLTDPRG